MSSTSRELTADELWNRCDPATFDFASTESLPGDMIIIGQDRAVRAIGFGIGIGSYGYNIFVVGDSRTGRTTTVRTFLDRVAGARPVPSDWIYVHNFEQAERPCAIPLPPGRAVEFQRDMQELLNDLRAEIPRAFESEAYERRKEKTVRSLQARQNAELIELEAKVGELGFALIKTETGLGLAPALNGQVVSPEAFEQLDQEAQDKIVAQQEPAAELLTDTLRSMRKLEKELKKQLVELDRRVVSAAADHLMEELKQKYGQLPEVPDYMAQVKTDIVDHLEGFRSQDEDGVGGPGLSRAEREQELARRYAVNVLVDNSRLNGAPVIVEPNPTYDNLMGRIEHRVEFGALVTDLTLIRAGALHRANGGYLVLAVHSLLSSPNAWEGLKRALKNQQIRIEPPGGDTQAAPPAAPQPEPIPLNIKVLLLGDPDSYYALYDLDEEVRKLFKVKAEFGAVMERTPETSGYYAQFVAARCHEEALPHVTPEAVAMIVEHGSRLAEHQQKLSTRFGEIADLVREAGYWAQREHHGLVLPADVQKAIDEKTFRSNHAEEEMQSLLGEGTIRVQLDGQVIGQVNGLSVLSLGDYEFGRPSRITVRTYTGKSGVISLDREARLSGRIYDKGVLTLSGYLGGKYAIDNSLSLSATVSFEQLYDEVEGDSATSGELYGLLSSLSGLPIRQSVAVTGSVDQQGNIQPVGGVNEKIEGFFETCRRRGLTGDQGVIVPAQNVVNLVLRPDVRQAVAEGKFHIYPVETVDQGIEILTGVPAGELQADGLYPVASVHGMVMARLAEIAENLREQKDEEGIVDEDPYDSEMGASGIEARPVRPRSYSGG